MKLYISPGACSLSPHIALRESGLAHELVKVDLRAHKTATGGDFYTINPNGYVPLLELDSGERFAEGPVIVQYIADQVPDKKLAPANGTIARYHLQQWLNFVGTELHKQFTPLFNAGAPDEVKQGARDKLHKRFTFVENSLAKTGPYLMGEQFTVADGYLFTMLTWAGFHKLPMDGMPTLAEYKALVAARPAVQAALAAEAAMRS